MTICAKVYHMTYKSASNHADTLEDVCGERPTVYRCKKCKQFHVGYARSRKLSKSARRGRNYSKAKKRKKRIANAPMVE